MKKLQIRTYGNPQLATLIINKLDLLGYYTGLLKTSADHYFNVHGESTMHCGPQTARDITGDNIGSFITLDELFEMQPEAKETIKIGTQTYDKADFEAATKHLTTIK
jgi:hypothetical protein